MPTLDLHKLSEEEILNAAMGASIDGRPCLSAFTEGQILTLCDHPGWPGFSGGFKALVWATLGEVLDSWEDRHRLTP